MSALIHWIRKQIKRLIKFVLTAIALLMLLSVLAVLSLRWLNPIGSMLMVERKIEAWRAGSSLTLSRQWQDASRISDQLKLAVIASEDQNFTYHHGFDMKAIKAAFEHNAKGGATRGASTISQQVAKNLFLWSGRSWFRKGLEVWFTAWIEVLWSKERTLEIYLNTVEWGNGVFGAEAAASYYFSNTAQKLTSEQASALAAILPNPRQWSASKPSAYIRSRMIWIQTQMQNLGGMSFLIKLTCPDGNCDQ